MENERIWPLQISQEPIVQQEIIKQEQPTINNKTPSKKLKIFFTTLVIVFGIFLINFPNMAKDYNFGLVALQLILISIPIIGHFISLKHGSFIGFYKFPAIVSYFLPFIIALITFSGPLPDFSGLGAVIFIILVIGGEILFHFLAIIITSITVNFSPVENRFVLNQNRKTVNKMSGSFLLLVTLLIIPELWSIPSGKQFCIIFLSITVFVLIIKYWKNIFRKY